DEQLQAMVTLTILVGLFQLGLGLLKLGFLTRFISNAVMTGFLTGIGVIIILSQLGDLTGYAGEGNNKVAQTVDLLRNLSQVDLQTLALGLLTLVLIVVLDRTRLGPVSMLVALVVAALLVPLLDWASVILVGDIAEIPRSLPSLALPSLVLVPQLLLSAVAIGIIGLVQAAGVSQGFPNPDGRYPDASGDFRGQGLANLAAGFFRGIPLGGSLSGTSLVVKAGAQSRWANILTGAFVAVGVLLFATAIERLPMTALAAILIYAGYQTIKPARIRTVWRTSTLSRTVMIVTFVATLFLPVQQAVLAGVLLHVILFVFQAAERMTIVELVPVEGDDFREQPAPAELPDKAVTILLPYGSLFYAGAADFEEEVPSADQAHQAVVILILRGRGNVGSTLLNVLKRYDEALQENDGQLILADVNEAVREQLSKTGMLEVFGADNVLPAQPLVLASLQEALAAGQRRLAELSHDDEVEAGPGSASPENQA
ncbi:MAG: SulP family inorganic anion transporter, partial [Anaerolineae bacterium]|nr:SulP family inorganic anion transporter [Anaerolineae bacterium]